jgi:prepilin-type N-terminal cleavage/methylation domain-containing protein
MHSFVVKFATTNIDLYIKAKQNGFTLIEIMISIAVLSILAALAIPSLGSLLNRNYTRSAATSFQDDLRLARYEARTRSKDIVTFCAIASSVKDTNINCSATDGYNANGWLWYAGTVGTDAVLLGKNYAPLDSGVSVTPNFNFFIEIEKSKTTLRDVTTLNEIPIPSGATYPSITFSGTSGRDAAVVFNETGRTSLEFN